VQTPAEPNGQVQESEVRGATVMYCTHILDGLSGWPTHHMHMHEGRVAAFGAYPLEVQGAYQADSASEGGSSLYKQVQALLQAKYEFIAEEASMDTDANTQSKHHMQVSCSHATQLSVIRSCLPLRVIASHIDMHDMVCAKAPSLIPWPNLNMRRRG
jgi:ABC-type uncharacterized transport system ATPase subunit